MPTLVLAIEKPYWQDVLLNMQQRGLEIAATVIHYRDVGAPNHFFDKFQGKLIDGKSFYRLDKLTKKLYQDFGNDVPALDLATINDFADIERDYYALTDRFNYFPKSFRYRKRLFRQSIRYYLAFFKANKIDSLFAAGTPHNLADFMCFHAAKKLGLPTVIATHTILNDQILIRYDYRSDDKVPADFMPNACANELQKVIPETLYNAAIKPSNILNYVIQKNDASVGVKNLNVETSSKKINTAALKRNVKRYFTSPRYTNSMAMNAVTSKSFRRLLKKFEYYRLNKLRKYLQSVSITADLNENFIYFAMHLQPERTSQPESEIFEDQLMAIEILAAAMPVGWKLYVKENPRQFDKLVYLKSRHFRDVADYQAIARLPNVHLISQKIPSKQLIAKAKATATLTGSIGWEALQMGKPAIVFGNAWFSECESIFRVASVEDAKNAISKMQEISPEQTYINLLRYLAYKKDSYTIGNMGDPADLKVAAWPYEKLVGDMAERVFGELKNISS